MKMVGTERKKKDRERVGGGGGGEDVKGDLYDCVSLLYMIIPPSCFPPLFPPFPFILSSLISPPFPFLLSHSHSGMEAGSEGNSGAL